MQAEESEDTSELKITPRATGRSKAIVTVAIGDRIIESAEIAIQQPGAREAFARQIAKKCPGFDSDMIREELLRGAGELAAKASEKRKRPTPSTDTIYTELGNAEKTVARFKGRILYVPEWKMFVCHDGKRFIPDITGVVQRIVAAVARSQWEDVANAAELDIDRDEVMKHIRKMETSSGVNGVSKLASIQKGVPRQAAEFDANPFLLNVENGVLDMRVGELRDHSPADLMTKLAPVAYDRDAECPLWDAFLLRAMDGKQHMVDYLSRIIGMCLTGDITLQEFFILYGAGANGKSVFTDTVMTLMGDYAGLAPPGLLTTRTNEEHPTELADLQGRRLIIGSETEEGQHLRVQLVKRLTGDATIKARRMRCDYFEFPRTFKMILQTNNRPVIREDTHAIWRRIRLIPFDVVIPAEERDPQLSQKLLAELPGILTWAVRGCIDWTLNGMQTPAEVLAATNEYQATENPLAEFVADRCVVGGNARVGRGEIYDLYLSYCTQIGDRYPLSRKELFERIRKVNGVTDAQWKPFGSAVPIRGFKGIGIMELQTADEPEMMVQ